MKKKEKVIIAIVLIVVIYGVILMSSFLSFLSLGIGCSDCHGMENTTAGRDAIDTFSGRRL